MPDQTKEKQPNQTWLAFEKRHPGTPFLNEDPVYSLAEDVLDAITQELPNFFTQEELGFERDLARMTGGGFYLRRPIGTPTSVLYKPGLTVGEFIDYSYFPHRDGTNQAKRLNPAVNPEWFKDEPIKQMSKAIEDFQASIWEASGKKKTDINAAVSQAQDEERLILRRAEAYSGWLILNKQFHQELGVLRAECQAWVTRQGGLPKPAQETGSGATSGRRKGHGPGRDACFAFYRRWCLDRMLTWELPAPLDVRLHFSAGDGPLLTIDEGVTLLLPWYMLRGGQFDLQEVVRRIRFEVTPAHLRAWVSNQPGSGGESTGEISYQRLYGLYRCYELVLFRRYPRACKKNIEKLDQILAALMQRESDWVKRLRQRMRRILSGR